MTYPAGIRVFVQSSAPVSICVYASSSATGLIVSVGREMTMAVVVTVMVTVMVDGDGDGER
jgi:hypothetical protein